MLCSVLSSPDSSASILALPGEKRELGEEERSLFTWQVLFRPPTSGGHPGASCLAAVARRTPGSLRGTVPQCGRCALNHLFWSLHTHTRSHPATHPTARLVWVAARQFRQTSLQLHVSSSWSPFCPGCSCRKKLHIPAFS